MNHRTCLERPTPPPTGDEQAVGSWLVAMVAYVFADEAPCGKPATHIAFWGKPLCEHHAAVLRERLRERHTLAGILRGSAGDGKLTDAEIARVVRPIEAVS